MCTSTTTKEGELAYTSAEWRQEPRRHVTDAPPLRSPCRRGFAPLRPPLGEQTTTGPRARQARGVASREDRGSSRPRIAWRALGIPATYCATADRHRDQSILDDRRVESGAADRATPPSSSSIVRLGLSYEIRRESGSFALMSKNKKVFVTCTTRFEALET